ncbi:MAG: acyl carrier protein [Planctomycetota bacterium]|nr:MAG: acyl carrier protein [Planctomycetota bacterium]REJ97836.1 MAG: acyl carrier protein [Planctomycetota bacterium]REK22898.1 MAG: acyl carrier protein [Planctomycetota bacterium]REK37402.1 MAG: acyl carrier protein [Planctomycetota bacterium]
MTLDLATVSDRIAGIYLQVAPDGEAPAEDGRGQLDSMAFLEFITLLEKEFQIAVDAEDVTEANFATRASTAAYVLQKLANH